MKESSRVTIFVRDVVTEIRIGLHEHEKAAPQRVIVNVALEVEGADYIMERQPVINYESIYNELKAWAERAHVLYIETYLRELLGVAFRDERVAACRISLFKPDIFPESATVGVETYMTRADYLAKKQVAQASSH